MGAKKQKVNIETLKQQAAAGDITAQFRLGNIYEYGKGVEKDGDEACAFYEMAARQGDSEAQLALGFLYSKGKLVKQDYALAKFWFEKAANQGDEIAQFNLAELYEYGRGTEQDYRKAFELYKQVCERANDFAFLALANLYFHGRGAEKDIKAAKFWLHKSLNDGDPDEDNKILNLVYLNAHLPDPQAGLLEARKWLEYLIKSRKITPERIKSLFLDKDEHNFWNTKERMPLWFLSQAEKGNRHALYCIGLIYKNGWTVRKNEKLGDKFIELSECGDMPQGYLYLAQKYECAGDYAHARYLYELAARHGERAADLSLAFLYAKGLGVKKDYARAWQYLKALYETTDSETLGRLKEYIRKNNLDMRSLFGGDAEKGIGEAEYYHALQYQKGYGVERDESITSCWLSKGAWHGLPAELAFWQNFSERQ